MGTCKLWFGIVCCVEGRKISALSWTIKVFAALMSTRHHQWMRIIGQWMALSDPLIKFACKTVVGITGT